MKTLEKYTSSINEDLNKRYLIEVPDAHKVENRSDKNWYLPYHLGFNFEPIVRTR